ncbi:hypothetical protein LJC23_03530, partial [Desulfovibrio sp. OttesenSCG-928-I05]|nr:hypothetical protein [Desulfovibrio sp. OttesenSCG-928-I05]
RPATFTALVSPGKRTYIPFIPDCGQRPPQENVMNKLSAFGILMLALLSASCTATHTSWTPEDTCRAAAMRDGMGPTLFPFQRDSGDMCEDPFYR